MPRIENTIRIIGSPITCLDQLGKKERKITVHRLEEEHAYLIL